MGMGKNIIIFLFIFSFVLWLIAGYQTPAMEVMNCMSDPGNKLNVTTSTGMNITSGACSMTIPGGFVVDYSLYTILFGTLALFATLTIGITLLVGRFPDPYVYFSVAGIFLLAFVTFPVSLMNATGNGGLPAEIRFLVGGLFVIAYVISFFEFYKGGSL